MLLAIDTSTRAGSVALLDGEVLEERALGRADHGADLAPTVAALLQGGRLARVSGYALSIGPGSFTGLRIGLAFLKGLAVVHPRPVAPVSTLRVLAEAILAQHPGAAFALPALDARRDEVFAALFARGPTGLEADARLVEGVHALVAARAVAERLPGPVVVGGEGAGLAPWGDAPFARDPAVTPRAGLLARLAAPLLASGAGVEADRVELAYLQQSAAEEKLAAAR
jgi:tRNA threonylcarbamoyladenosine biosynthesis protein TsaB